MYVPEIAANLFSVSALVKRGYVMVTSNRECKLKKNNTVGAIGQLEEEIFMLNMLHSEMEKANHSKVEKLDSLQTWHKRLYHQNFKYV